MLEIDFFEILFLAQVCIPPVPIARGMFWERLIDELYPKLNDDQRKQFFKNITEQYRFSVENEECLLFYNRYNPDNQYAVTVSLGGVEIGFYHCFLHKDSYHTSKKSSVIPEAITNIRPFNATDYENCLSYRTKVVKKGRDTSTYPHVKGVPF